mmetsp:Transcript_37056/g.67500  ORF Transcript_37056/g.67500 Transcript_37056/m.67500 type:complete len:761 (+) Transcript_37056:130-2412(+)
MASYHSALVLVALAVATQLSWGQVTLDKYKESKKNATAAASAEAAVEAKMTAVDKVISMMKNLRSQVVSEGSTEADLYDKFACFCKDTQEEKTAAISKGTDDSQELTARINELASNRDTLDTTIASLETAIVGLTKEMDMEKASRANTNAVYTTNEQDTSDAIFALEKAIQSMKASKTSAAASLVQMQSVAKTARTAMLMADALGLVHSEDKKVVALFLQSADGEAPEVEMEDYKFHSGDIISTLEKLLKDFKATKVELDSAEVASVQQFQMVMQTKTDQMKAKELELSEAKATRDAKIASIAANNEELSVTAATLLDDQKYLSELNTLCSNKAKTWDQRNQLRADELSTLTTVIGILEDQVKTNTSAVTMRLVQQGRPKILFGAYASGAVAHSEAAMEALEAAAEGEEDQDSAPVGFLQRRQQRAVQPHLKISGREAVSKMLKSEGAKLRSTLLTALASRIQGGADPFAKIKVMIQEMIDKLLKEETSEANQKGYCDKAIADSTQKRTYAAEKVEALNANLAELEATRDSLAEGMSTLSGEIADLKAKQSSAEKQRSEEESANAATVQEAKEGLSAINLAIDIMDKFYKTVAKAEVSLVQGPADDAPDAGFKNFEAYKGSQAESGGIIGMMDVIKSDFERTIADTQAAEAAAKMEHLEFTTATQKSIKTKETAESQKSKIKGEVDSTILEDKASLGAQMTILQTAVTELIAWKAECIDTGMTYNKRVENREDEIADLKKALCILENYDEYGEGAEATTC